MTPRPYPGDPERLSPSCYFIRYLPEATRPYRVYYYGRDGRLRRSRSSGYLTPGAAVAQVQRLEEMDAERARERREAA